jgi:hypothetical protein
VIFFAHLESNRQSTEEFKLLLLFFLDVFARKHKMKRKAAVFERFYLDHDDNADHVALNVRDSISTSKT